MTGKSWVVAVVCSLLLAASAAAQCDATLVPVSQPVFFPNHSAGPVAWTGSQYGVAKQDADVNTKGIYFSIYDANLNQVRADKLVTATSANGPQVLLWNGTEFALFYQTTQFQIVFQRLDTLANLIGGPIAVAPLHSLAPGIEFDAAWDPTRKAYIVLHSITFGFERGVWLSVVDAGGSLLSDEPVTFFIADPVFPRVAVTSTGTIGIVWSRLVNGGQQELAFGIATPGQPITNIATIRAGGSNPRLATDGRFFLVVYNAAVSGGSVLRWVKFDTAARVVTADAQLLAVGQDVIAFSLIANPTLSEWGLLYVTYPLGVNSPALGETRLRRIPFSGAAITDEPFAADLTKRTLAPQSQLAWNGFSYVASIGRFLSRPEGTESYLARLCPLVVTATASAAVGVLNVPIRLTANPSGGAAPYSFTWSFGDVSANENGQSVTHAYTQVGTYTATVTATDVNGSVATASVRVTILKVRRHVAGRP